MKVDGIQAAFSDPDRAAAYVAQGIAHDFPNAEVELILCEPGRSRYQTAFCRTHELAAELSRMCRSFPGASVEYTPNRAYGFVAVIHSSQHRYYNPSERTHDASRYHMVAAKNDGRKVAVFVRQVNAEEVLLGSKSIVPPTPRVAG